MTAVAEAKGQCRSMFLQMFLFCESLVIKGRALNSEHPFRSEQNTWVCSCFCDFCIPCFCCYGMCAEGSQGGRLAEGPVDFLSKLAFGSQVANFTFGIAWESRWRGQYGAVLVVFIILALPFIMSVACSAIPARHQQQEDSERVCNSRDQPLPFLLPGS